MKITECINDAKQICGCDSNSSLVLNMARDMITREIDGLMPAYHQGEDYIDEYIDLLMKTRDFYENRLKELK